MANMKQKIDNNRKLLPNGREKEEFTRTCSGRDKTSCPPKGKCLQGGVVYKAIVTQTIDGAGLCMDDGKPLYNEIQPPQF